MKYIATKKSIVTTKDEKNCKMNVATQKSMSRHNEELKVEVSIPTMIVVAIEFCLNNQIHVAIINAIE